MSRIYINEVAPRDGLQVEAVFVPTQDKIALIDRLSATGLARIEATSFTSPKAIPNLPDLVGHATPGHIVKAGKADRRYPMLA